MLPGKQPCPYHKMANLTKYNILISLVVAWGGFAYGFGFAIFVTSVGQPGFYIYFKLDPSSDYTANILGDQCTVQLRPGNWCPGSDGLQMSLGEVRL
jgi:hypothetical protein